MLLAEDIAKQVAGALAATFARRSADFTADTITKGISSWLKQWRDAPPRGIQKIAQDAIEAARQEGVAQAPVEMRTLARWFEILEEDFRDAPPERLEADVLIRHVYLETLFRQWLSEWNYSAEVGEEMNSPDGEIDFTADVYGELPTLHGVFQVVISLFCDKPPSAERALAMIQNLDYVVPKGGRFGRDDIFMLVTPFDFPALVEAAIRRQSGDAEYTVAKVESGDLWDLIHEKDAAHRLEELMERIAKFR